MATASPHTLGAALLLSELLEHCVQWDERDLSLVPSMALSAVWQRTGLGFLRTLVAVLPLNRGTEGEEGPGFCLPVGQWGEPSPCSLSFCPLCSLSPPPALRASSESSTDSMECVGLVQL